MWEEVAAQNPSMERTTKVLKSWMNWVCSASRSPFPHPCSLSLIHSPYIIVKNLTLKIILFPFYLGCQRNLWQGRNGTFTPYYTWKCSYPIGREGRKGLSCTPVYCETTRTQYSIYRVFHLKPEFYWQMGICILSKFRACLSSEILWHLHLGKAKVINKSPPSLSLQIARPERLCQTWYRN